MFLSGFGLCKKYEKYNKIDTKTYIRHSFLKLFWLMLPAVLVYAVRSAFVGNFFRVGKGLFSLTLLNNFVCNILPFEPGVYWYFGLTFQLYIVYLCVRNIVNMGYPIINLIDVDDIWVYFNIKETMLSKFKMGTKFEAIIPGLDNQKVELQVKYVAAQGDYATWNATKSQGDFDMKTFLIKAYPVKKVAGLRPGMSALVNEADLK